MRKRRVLKVWSLHDGVHRARLLAKPAKDALRHVYVVSRRSSTSVLSLLRLDRDRLRWAYGLAQLTRDASFLTRGIPSQRVFASKPRRQRSLFERVVDRHLFIEEVLQRQRHPSQELREHERLRARVQDAREIGRHRLLREFARAIGARGRRGRSRGGVAIDDGARVARGVARERAKRRRGRALGGALERGARAVTKHGARRCAAVVGVDALGLGWSTPVDATRERGSVLQITTITRWRSYP